MNKKQIEAKLDADSGYLREKIKFLGENSILSLISSRLPPSKKEVEESTTRLRFIADTWLGNVGVRHQQKFYRRRGIAA